MTFKQKIEQRQKAVFTQALQQSVKFLELPLLELKETIENQIAENPALEEIPSSAAAEAGTRQEQSAPEEQKETGGTVYDDAEKQLPGREETLTDFLLKQLRINARHERQISLGTLLIHQIDENGYLHQAPEALAQENETSLEEILDALDLIQTFEPAGVGARNIRECLLLQLKRHSKPDPLALELITHHLTELAEKNHEKLRKKLKCSEEELAKSIAAIHNLEPKPGRRFFSENISYITPDITIEEKDGELLVGVKDDILPAIRINPLYRSMLKSNKVNEETKEFIRQRIFNANNLMRAIRSRKDTLLKVVSLIAEIQREAVLEGIEKLKPLSLKEVAEKIALHESTISRVVANKYVQAPAGIFALKDLFSFSLKNTVGEEISAQRIKAKIQELIENEDKKIPLKDHAIASLLQESEKILLARRTVAKYREELQIPPASQRKKSS